jgi:hypothetical protein
MVLGIHGYSYVFELCSDTVLHTGRTVFRRKNVRRGRKEHGDPEVSRNVTWLMNGYTYVMFTFMTGLKNLSKLFQRERRRRTMEKNSD